LTSPIGRSRLLSPSALLAFVSSQDRPDTLVHLTLTCRSGLVSQVAFVRLLSIRARGTSAHLKRPGSGPGVRYKCLKSLKFSLSTRRESRPLLCIMKVSLYVGFSRGLPMIDQMPSSVLPPKSYRTATLGRDRASTACVLSSPNTKHQTPNPDPQPPKFGVGISNF